jgi:hypothetical protein
MHAPRSRGAARAQSDSSVNVTKVIVIKHDRKVVIVRNTLASHSTQRYRTNETKHGDEKKIL